MPERASGEDFLRKKYPNLHTSADVDRGVTRHERIHDERLPNNPKERIGAYLTRLEQAFMPKDTVQGERNRSLLKRRLHDQFVIDEADVPERYFALQQQVARERGHGDVEISETMRAEMSGTVIRDQEESLDGWVDYLSTSDAPYPAWFRYFAFRSITKLAPYNKERQEFPKRSKKTTGIFPDIDREALAYVYDALTKSTTGNPDNEDQDILDRANFGELYAHAIETANAQAVERGETTEGAWVTYPQGSDAEPLWQSLQGYGTGWCTAGEGTAAVQLQGGDFHVYYTNDGDNNPTIPRVAIRMEGGVIAEVRGVNSQQNLEGELMGVAEERLETLPGSEAYKKKTADMRQLTDIEHRHQDGDKLTKDDLRFLYEIDGKIEGFGYGRDPRIGDVLTERDAKEDYATIFDCDIDQVVMRFPDMSSDTHVVISTEPFPSSRISELPKSLQFIAGALHLEVSKISELPEGLHIGGGLYLGRSKINELPKGLHIGGSLHLSDSNVSEIPEGIHIGGDLNLADSNVSELPQGLHIGGSLHLRESNVRELPEGLHIGGSLHLRESNVRKLPEGLHIGGALFLRGANVNRLPEGLHIGGDLDLEDSKINELPKGLHIGGSLSLRGSNISALPEGLHIGGDLHLADSKVRELPKGLHIGGALFLRGANVNRLPEGLHIGGDLDLGRSKINELPKGLHIGGSLSLRGSNVSELPEGLYVGGYLDLANSGVSEIPAGLHLHGDLVLGFSRVSELPEELHIDGDLYLESSKISELPKGLHIGGSLSLRGSNVSELPEGLHIGGDLYLWGSNISEIPEGIHIGRDLVLQNTHINKIPEGLRIGRNLHLRGSKINVSPESIFVGGRIIRE